MNKFLQGFILLKLILTNNFKWLQLFFLFQLSDSLGVKFGKNGTRVNQKISQIRDRGARYVWKLLCQFS